MCKSEITFQFLLDSSVYFNNASIKNLTPYTSQHTYNDRMEVRMHEATHQT